MSVALTESELKQFLYVSSCCLIAGMERTYMAALFKVLKSSERFFARFMALKRSLPIQIDITNSCNLACKHCYHAHHNNHGALTFNELCSILSQYYQLIKRCGARPEIILSGGEPTISAHFKSISETISTQYPGTVVHILTNGTHFPDIKSVHRLSENCDLRVQISLEGPDQISHEMVRGSSSFEKALKAIPFYQGIGASVSLLATLTRKNAMRIEEFFQLAKAHGVYQMRFTRFISVGSGNEWQKNESDLTLSPADLKRAYQQILVASVKYGMPLSEQVPLMTLLDRRLGGNGRFAEAIVVDYQGFLLASSRSRLRLAKIDSTNLADLFFNHKHFRRLRAGDVATCSKCEHFSACGGDRNAAFAHNGDFFGPDPGCWLLFENTRYNVQSNRS